MSPRPNLTTEDRENDRRTVARHEAGHALVALLLGYNAKSVELGDFDADDEERSYPGAVLGSVKGCENSNPAFALALWRTRPVLAGMAKARRLAVAGAVRMLLAGAAAEAEDPHSPPTEWWYGALGTGTDSDMHKVKEILSGVLGEAHSDPYHSGVLSAVLREEWGRVFSVLEMVRPAVDRVVRALLRHEYLSWEKVDLIVGEPPREAVERIREVPRWANLAAPLPTPDRMISRSSAMETQSR